MNTIAGRLHPSTSEPLDCAGHQGVVAAEQFAPASVSQARCLAGRVDDVGEQHCRQHAVKLNRWQPSGQELLNRVEQRDAVGREGQRVCAWDFDALRAVDALREVLRLACAGAIADG